MGSACASVAQQTTITLTDNLTFNAGNGRTICLGQTFTPAVTGNATSYSWSPTAGVSNPAIANPVLSPTATTTYTVTATLGTCTKTGTVTVVVAPGATADAGADAFIIAGDSYSLQGSGSRRYLPVDTIGWSERNEYSETCGNSTGNHYIYAECYHAIRLYCRR